MDAESIGKLLAGMLSGGAVGNISLAIAEGLKLANALNEPDPHKRARIRRAYYMSLINIIREVENAPQEDIDKLLGTFIKLMDD